MASSRSPRAFTLIELLVVIAIIALLVAILLPALANARKLARQVREAANLQQLTLAHSTYMGDWKGGVTASYVISGETFANGAMNYNVFDDAGRRLESWPAKRWAWRLMPYLNNRIDALVTDTRLADDMRSLPSNIGGAGGYQMAVSFNPSFGYNGSWVGSEMAWFSNFALGQREPQGGAGGLVYRRTSQVVWNVNSVDRSARGSAALIMFGTSRGPYYQGRTPTWQTPPWESTWDAEDAEVRPGFYSIIAPRLFRNMYERIAFSDSRPFFEFTQDSNPERWGFLDGRHFNKALVSFFDGHVELRGAPDLWDMRSWSIAADSATWISQPGSP
ncbi:MAG: type II secretion system protein [Phycisphaerales bacterium]|jgi:prepilin-type N-terminal cleavage/methylation domain-containing protein/prepilin-type processing-associated H-X9-DG protein|nr:type II secretion system GspH family protein [Phycisphaeraceae bacterium]